MIWPIIPYGVLHAPFMVPYGAHMDGSRHDRRLIRAGAIVIALATLALIAWMGLNGWHF